ncbi:hypothetical protein B0H11DRAFT_1913649 [Mycena galericulata]|nr:hypothetical protein B0H11DRAFT_1913649 [Mycena galericulata]
MGRRGYTRSHGPEVDESDPASIRRYQKWRSSFLYNDRNRAERNDKKRQQMEILRAKQSLDSPKVQMARLAAKRASAAKYRENTGLRTPARNRAHLAMKSRQRRDVRRFRREDVKKKAFRRTGKERDALEAAIADLEPESDGEGEGSDTDS